MKSWLKVLLVILGSLLALIIFIFVMFSLALRTTYINYNSEVTGIRVLYVREIEFAYPRNINMLSDSTYPLVLCLSLEIRDSIISRKRNVQAVSLIPEASAAVDPGRINTYSFSDSISKIRIFSILNNDSFEITSDFKLLAYRDYANDKDDSIACTSENSGIWIMRKITFSPDRYRNILLCRFRDHQLIGDRIKVTMLFSSGRILSADYIPSQK